MLDCLKKRLEGAQGKWVDELLGVLWSFRTTKRRSTYETPFCMAYGTKEILSPHITVPSMSIEVGNLDQNYKQMKVNLDLLEEERRSTKARVKEDEAQLGKPLCDQPTWRQRKLCPRHSRREGNSETMECPPPSEILSMKLLTYQLGS
ncbi:unnamed protein product [Prunus armeniaca]